MSKENFRSANLCLHCKYDLELRYKRMTELDQYYEEERKVTAYSKRLEQQQMYTEKRKLLDNKALCLHCIETKHQGYVMNCPACSFLQQELEEKDHTIEELKKNCEKLRSEADINKKMLEDFKERISVEASGEIGCSSKIFEDVNNPCRESELRKSYEKLGLNAWPKCLQKIKGISKMRRGDPADEKNEKEIAERMIKRVFEKALTDMEKKKEAMKTLFNLNDSAVHNKKQLQCMEMAVQNLQRLILYEKFTHYQDINKELGNNHPDYLCELADDCYKQGCLMALHDPPLILDWNKKKDHCGCPFPPIKLGEEAAFTLQADRIISQSGHGHDGESI